MDHKDNIIKHFFGIPPPPGYNYESIVLESANIRHGDNCDCCTSVKDSQRFEEEYQHKIKQAHKGLYKGVRAQRAKKQEEQQQQDDLVLPKPQEDEPNPMEDLGPI